jgi:hypothetical protein
MTNQKVSGKPSAAPRGGAANRKQEASASVEKSARDAIRLRRRFFVGLAAAMVGLQVFSPATLVVFMLGMVPTLVAYLADTDIRKRSAHCMAILNLAGVIPVLTWLWQNGATRSAAAGLLSDPMNWLLMYGSAGLAALLISGMPVVVNHALGLHNARQAKILEKELSRLSEEWGVGVTQPPPAPDGKNHPQSDAPAGTAAGAPAS